MRNMLFARGVNNRTYDRLAPEFQAKGIILASVPIGDYESITTYADCSRFNYEALILESWNPGACVPLVHRVRDKGYTIPIIVMGHPDGGKYRAEVLNAGADAYVVDDHRELAELFAVIDAAIRGRAYGHEDARALLARLTRPDVPQALKAAS